MSIRFHASWFPWLLFVVIALQSAARYTLLDPLFGDNDRPLLYVIFAVVLWKERSSIAASLRGMGTGSLGFGSLFFIVGLVFYIAGHLYPVMLLEFLGLFFIAAGLVATLAPPEYQSSAFLIVLSGTVIVVIGRMAPILLSSDLAVFIAALSAKIVNQAFFPVIADGVHLYFGPYGAEVTEACSGMRSIFSLTALSLIYLRLDAKRKPWHILVLVACILPVAVLTNLSRVILLVLATWYIGDGFAQGLFHETAGLVLFVMALAILALIDYLLSFASSFLKQTGKTVHAHNQV